jgi:hypothetical protein
LNKTPIRKRIVERLASLNDQLCFFLMLEAELTKRLTDFGPNVQGAYTSDMFRQNIYAPKIHVKIGDLPAFQQANRTFTFGAYFSTSYEVAADFFGLALNFLRQANHITVSRLIREGPEETFARTVSAAKLNAPPPALLRTFSYARHRRNSIIHIASSVSPGFSKVANDFGSGVNQYWGATRSVLDFSKATISPLGEDECIALLKLLRISVESLDGHLATILDRGGVLHELGVARFGHKPTRINSDVIRRRRAQLDAMFHEEFGGKATSAELDLVVRSVGVR